MAFWGIEVKPGEPYTHLYDNARGRLRICQATLGTGNSASRSVVQCNVGDNSPVFLCSLIPEKTETCRLELEFEEEEDEVVFSVLGQKSVHLSGYYVGRPGRISDEDELDSYGEDIADTDTSGSYDSYDDEYESDFIDDDDNAIFPHSPRRRSGVVIEEIIEDEMPSTGNAGRRRLKKKYQLSDSDDHDDSKCQPVVKQNNPSIFESEDEDGFPISMHSRKVRDGKPLETATKASAEERVNDKLDKDQKNEVKEQKVESSGIETDDTENDSKPKKKKKRKKKKGKKSETDAVGPVKQTDEHVKEKANEPGKLPTENAQESSVKSRKKNRKRKRREGNSEETEKKAGAMELQKSNAVEQLSNVSPGVEAADKTTDDDRKDAKGKKKRKRKRTRTL